LIALLLSVACDKDSPPPEKADAPSGMKIEKDFYFGFAKSVTVNYADVKKWIMNGHDSYQLKSMLIKNKYGVSASVQGNKPNLTLKMALDAGETWGGVELKVTLESSKYKDVSLSTSLFIFPPVAKVTKLSLLKFPEKDSAGNSWDSSESGVGKKPDIYYKIYDDDAAKLHQSRYTSNVDSSSLPLTWLGSLRVDLSDNVFRLFDYDSSSSSNSMGEVTFGPMNVGDNPLDFFPKEYTFKSKDDKIHIKVYFQYAYL